MDSKPDFTSKDHQTWGILFNAQSKLREQQIVSIFSKGLSLLGIDEKKIPDLDEVNQKLKVISGWQAVYVEGFIPAQEFFKMLSEKKFPVGNFIRDSKDLNYTPAPDVFHDLYGHVPFYTDLAYCNFCQKFGEIASKYTNFPEVVEAFQRFFWFTVEFALIKTKNGTRIFGAGIASSFSECAYALSEKPRVHPFDLKKISDMTFRIDVIQENLFILETEDQLYSCLNEFEKKIIGDIMNGGKSLENYFEKMWKNYCKMNPQAQSVFEKLTEYGEEVVNDHIAFRTFLHPKIDIKKLSIHFTKYGYVQAGEYEFVQKKLKAMHFEHPKLNMPKVFISALDLSQCSQFLKDTVNSILHYINDENINKEGFLFGGRPWPASFETYKKLEQESEYAAWLYAHGFRPNHFTVYINYLKKLNSIQDLNVFLENQGFKLNSSGGKVKGSPNDLLEQSSTMANEIPIEFTEGTYSVPACYYEFAKRYPMKNGKLFQGFVAQSADKIFESTNRTDS